MLSSRCLRYINLSLFVLLSLFVILWTNNEDLQFLPTRRISRSGLNLMDNIERNSDHNDTQPESNPVFKIPNIVHYIWYKNKTAPLKFHQMLSMMSALKFLKPDVIYFHTNNQPAGKYWDQVLKEIPVLKILAREPPVSLFGVKIKKSKFETAYSNIDRVKVLMEYGGIYMDLDVFVLKSFDDLRIYPCVLGMEGKSKICGGFIMAEKFSTFLNLWINSYIDDYKANKWAYNTGEVPTKLSKRYPNLVHIEPYKIHYPYYQNANEIWGNYHYNWKQNYAMHLWYRRKSIRFEPDPVNIRTMDNTFGEVSRYIYYGSSLLLNNTQK